MSSSEKKDDDPFAYESSVHSANVLRRLNSQRQQGLLCDVTVVVGDQRFQAHRAVLAASSDYFLSRVVQACHADLVIITLPEEVSVKGFLPLLQFAYTSKLLVDRDNLLEIRKVAKLLEIHDVEETCFEFLKLKFQDIKAEQLDFSRNKWCKTFCPKAVTGQQNESGKPPVHEVEDLWKGEFSQNLKCPVEIENVSQFPESPKQPCEAFCYDRENSTGFSSLCPKYRKFQKACKSERVRTTSACSSNQDAQSPSPAPSSDASQPKPQLEDVHLAKPDVELTIVCPQGTDVTYPNLTCIDNKVAMVAAYPPCFPLGPPDFSSVPFQCVYQPCRSLSYSDIPSDSSAAGLPEGSNSRQSSVQATEIPSSQMVGEPQVSASEKAPLIRELSNVEREVAEHLAKGFWPDPYPADFPCPQEFSAVNTKEPPQEDNLEKRAECPWLGISISKEAPERTFTTLNPVSSCPFISNLSNDVHSSSPRTSGEDSAHGKTQEKCPYACSLTLEDETDSDSEEGSIESSSAKELECERTLPFNAQKIISLSRYDFQSLVKMHNLSPEQLDCIHDIRRRSKNRIAAQRCRKRKLDCLQSLESEIQKLQDEKLNLLKERDKILSKLGETKQNFSGLCRQMWQDATLTQEHLNMLAKYSSDKCLLSLVVPDKGSRLPHCDTILPEFATGLYPSREASCRKAQEGNAASQSAGPRPILPPASALPGQSVAPAGTADPADPCQPMTPKSTTDEQK